MHIGWRFSSYHPQNYISLIVLADILVCSTNIYQIILKIFNITIMMFNSNLQHRKFVENIASTICITYVYVLSVVIILYPRHSGQSSTTMTTTYPNFYSYISLNQRVNLSSAKCIQQLDDRF